LRAKYFLLLSLTGVMLSAGVTAAADRPDQPLEEIVVTARFREADLMKTPGSDSVVPEITIFDRGSQHLDEILNILPNVNFSSGASRARFIQIRGIGDLEQFVDPKYFPSVGVTVDDVDMNGLASAAVMMDINQIELLRGPQGTRYGTNALAGMVNIRSNDPTEELSGSIEGGVADYQTWNLGAAVGGPLAERLLGRFAIRQYKSDGYLQNDFLGRDDTNSRDEFSVRGKLRWLGTGDSFVDLTAFYVDIDNGYDAFSLDNTRQTFSDEPGRDQQELWALSAKSFWAFSDHTAFEAILSGTDSDSQYSFDEDWSYPGICQPGVCFPYSNTDIQQRNRRNANLDMHFLSVDNTNFNWVGGLFVQRRDENFDRQYYGPFSSDYETDRYAAYGQIDYAWAEHWNFIAGLRFETFEDEYTDTNGLDTKSDDDYWTGELTLQYFLTGGTMFYGTLSRGAKPGGVNTEASSTFPLLDPMFQPFLSSRLRFGTETLLNKEIGVKGNYLDNALSLRLAVFHMDRDNAQLESWIWDDVNFLWTGYLDNANSAENYGAELELEYQPLQALAFFANVGLLQTQFDKLTVVDLGQPGQPTVSTIQTKTNRDQTKAPNWQYNIGTNLYFTSNLSARLEVEGRTESYYGYYHNQEIDGYALLNASIGYQAGPVDIRLWGRNLTDKDYGVHGLYFGNDPRKDYVNESYLQFGEPRVFGVNVSYGF
jgi:outer membrane receptor protein involved in Fe transport